MMNHTRAPWTPKQVAALNRWQSAGTVHEFTCPNNHHNRVLVAHEDGWRCPTCGYTQAWAHAVMLCEPPTSLAQRKPE